MSETDRTRDKAADAPVPTPPPIAGSSSGDLHVKADEDASRAQDQIAESRAKAAELDERLDKLEAEVRPEKPEPDHVDQAIGT
jgi:hypothetical protein